VLKFGGGKTLTKHDSVENLLKCPLSIEDAGRVGLDVRKLMDENVAKLCSPQVFVVEQEPKLKVVRVKKARAKRSKLSRVTQRLYDLESECKPEKPLNIELDLYQMETW
jgi:hypothetical protein